MAKTPGGNFITLTIRRSWIGQQATGATALLLETHEMKPIALTLSLEGISILRKELAKAEVLLRRNAGTA